MPTTTFRLTVEVGTTGPARSTLCSAALVSATKAGGRGLSGERKLRGMGLPRHEGWRPREGAAYVPCGVDYPVRDQSRFVAV